MLVVVAADASQASVRKCRKWFINTWCLILYFSWRYTSHTIVHITLNSSVDTQAEDVYLWDFLFM